MYCTILSRTFSKRAVRTQMCLMAWAERGCGGRQVVEDPCRLRGSWPTLWVLLHGDTRPLKPNGNWPEQHLCDGLLPAANEISPQLLAQQHFLWFLYTFNSRIRIWSFQSQPGFETIKTGQVTASLQKHKNRCFLICFNHLKRECSFSCHSVAPERAEKPFLWVQRRKHNKIQHTEVRRNGTNSADEYWTLTIKPNTSFNNMVDSADRMKGGFHQWFLFFCWPPSDPAGG